MAGLTVLVTGAAGLVGAEVTSRLVRAGHAVVALTHDRGDLVRNDGSAIPTAARAWPPGPQTVVRLRGDVTARRLALPDRRCAELVSAVDSIVHCAAVTDFGRPEATYRSVNVTGTAHVLELAASAGAPVVHVSTAYVCGERDGPVTEAELDVGQRFGNPYERSKLSAEALVRDSGLAATVVRPSIVVGARRSGVVRDFKNIYVMLKLVTEGRLRVLPGRYDALLDLVPVDRVADVVADAVVGAGAGLAGATLHAVGYPLSLRDISDVLAEYPSFEVPRFVPPEGFDAAHLPEREQRYHRSIGALYTSYFRRRPRFDDAATARLLGHRRLTGGPAFVRRLIDHCLRVGYLGAAPAPAPSPRVRADTAGAR